MRASTNEPHLQITFRDFPSTEALEGRIRHNAAKLSELFPKIVACRVALEAPHQRHRHGPRFRCRVDLVVPNAELVGQNADGDPIRDDAYAAIEDAFAQATRALEGYARRSRWDVKQHESTPHARVVKLMAGAGPGRAYGFLETHDGREIYFHEHAVLNASYRRLAIGTEVRFVEEDGEQGPQASTVAITKRRSRVSLPPRGAPSAAEPVPASRR